MKNQTISNRDRLSHILDSITTIENFIREYSRSSFLEDRKTIDATLFQFAVIGEVIVRVNEDILDKYDFPWYKVRAFRNFILHEYHAIEDRVIWDTIKKDLPLLKQIIEGILRSEFN
ncbi:MAG: DUF86 domain-containing protein [Bacteroidales bacterium]|nr:DUF86 domain-containing protein [Bacteroidales bacterium]MDT8373090.1 HepT-like ribonuclease domain-containing protein [Bacteroidales bacterium]